MSTINKISIAVLFIIAVASFSPLNSYAQDNSKQQMQSEVKSTKSGTLQDLQSKLIDQYGVNGFRFQKSNDAVTKTEKTLTAHELSESSGLDEYTIIIILAAIGAIAVILFIFK